MLLEPPRCPVSVDGKIHVVDIGRTPTQSPDQLTVRRRSLTTAVVTALHDQGG
jgi:hypothetical protein